MDKRTKTTLIELAISGSIFASMIAAFPSVVNYFEAQTGKRIKQIQNADITSEVKGVQIGGFDTDEEPGIDKIDIYRKPHRSLQGRFRTLIPGERAFDEYHNQLIKYGKYKETTKN
mgnify:CR=1 FL=1|jgi:hypothetical protein